MEAIIDSLKKAGKIFYPKTKTKAVYDDNNNRLDNTLTGITDSLNKNNFDTQVSIASYTSDNKYTAPNDGYVRAYVQKASSGYVHVRAESANGNGNYTQFTLVANDQTSSMNTMFVKKGMKLYIAGSSGTFTVVFNALI